MNIPIWQRIIGIILYMLPWSDSLTFGSSLFTQFPFLQYFIFPALPIIFLEKTIPFGSLILFLGLFLGVVRNPQISYFLRFNALQALLIDIILILVSYAFQILVVGLGSQLLIRTLSSTILISMLTIIIFTAIECLQGKEPDLPGISEAVKMQL